MQKQIYSLTILALCYLFIGCTNDDVNPTAEEVTCPDLDNYSYDTLDFESKRYSLYTSEIKADASVDYWELIEVQGSGEEILQLNGTCSNCSSTEWTSIKPTTGFNYECGLVGCYYKFFKFYKNDSIYSVNTVDSLMDFIGVVDSEEKAFQIVTLNGYSVTNYDASTTALGAVKKVDSGFEVRASKSKGGCGVPEVITSYHLHICEEGQLTELDSFEYSSGQGVCQ